MSTETYTVRVNPEGTSYYSYALAGVVEVDFNAALAAARRVFDRDSWSIIRTSDGIIMAQYDASGRDAMLWRNYRRDELAAARRAEVERQLEPRIISEMLLFERDIRRARGVIVDSSPVQPVDRIWRSMQRIKLYNAIDEAVRS